MFYLGAKPDQNIIGVTLLCVVVYHCICILLLSKEIGKKNPHAYMLALPLTVLMCSRQRVAAVAREQLRCDS